MEPISKSTELLAKPSSVSFVTIKLLPGILFLFIFFGCKKENFPAGVVTPVSTNQGTSTNPVITVSAGSNQHIAFNSECLLEGFCNKEKQELSSIVWKKIDGPAGGTIEAPNSLKTKVTNLEIGRHVFELAVRDLGGLERKAIVKVFVVQPGQNEVTFNDVEWVCPMGCSFTINNFNSFVPSDKPFKVFLREPNTTIWQQVPPESQWSPTVKYVYGKGDNSLWVYNDYAPGWVDLKITF